MLLEILRNIATSFVGRGGRSGGMVDTLSGIASEKVTQIAREKLGLPPEAPDADIEALLAKNPEIYAQIASTANQLAMEQERTLQVALQEQGESDRTATVSDDWYVRRARPTMLYLAGFSAFTMIVLGGAIAWRAPEQLSAYADLVAAASTPLSALMLAAGVYTYRRTTDKAIASGMPLPPIFGAK